MPATAGRYAATLSSLKPAQPDLPRLGIAPAFGSLNNRR